MPAAVRSGELDISALDAAVRRTLRLRFRLGLFDPIADQPMWHVPPEAVQSAEHVAAAVDATAQGLVLLLNGGGVVPGGRAGAAAAAVAAVPAAAAAVVSAVAASAAADPPVLPFRAGRKLAVVGPHANDRSTILGNYLGQMCADGFASRACVPSAFEALARRNDNGGPARTVNATGCAVNSTDVSGMAAAVAAAAAADAIVFVGGLDVTPPPSPPLLHHDPHPHPHPTLALALALALALRPHPTSRSRPPPSPGDEHRARGQGPSRDRPSRDWPPLEPGWCPTDNPAVVAVAPHVSAGSPIG